MKPLRLDPSALFDLAEAALVAGLDRDTLLLGLPPLFRAALPRKPAPVDQVLSDLDRLNTTPALRGFPGHPLMAWLHNAERATHDAEAQATFARARRTLMGQLATAPAEVVDQVAHSQSQGISRGQRGVFLSYGTPDRAAVDPLYDALRARLPADVPIFQDHRSIKPGTKWFDVLYEALGRASLVAAWVTPRFLAANYCKWELGVAAGRGARLVPIFPEGTALADVPAYITQSQGLRPTDPPDYGALAEALAGALDGAGGGAAG